MGILNTYNENVKNLLSEQDESQKSFDDPGLLEILSDIEHDRWSHWQEYLHSLCQKNDDGSLTIPKDSVDHWNKQIETDYADLSEKEKESDRKEARKTLDAITKYFDK